MNENKPLTPDTEAERRTIRRKKVLKEAREWIVSLAVALLVVTVLRAFVFTLIRVDGESMQTTLMDGERLFVTVADVKFGSVERGDVVICHYPDRGSTNFVKRVVAVPGDTVYRESNVTHVVYTEEIDAANPDTDGLVLDPENSKVIVLDSGSIIVDQALDPAWVLRSYVEPDYEPYELGENEYFVVGDNRYDSHDSRDWNDDDPSRDVGPITKDMITGRVRQVIWPPDSFRPVE